MKRLRKNHVQKLSVTVDVHILEEVVVAVPVTVHEVEKPMQMQIVLIAVPMSVHHL